MMRRSAVVVCLLGLASCAAPGASEDYRWSVEVPKTVERGAGFQFTVHAMNADHKDVAEVPYRYEITWPAGGGNPLKQGGTTGKPSSAHARMVAGPATIVVRGIGRNGAEVKVWDGAFEVK